MLLHHTMVSSKKKSKSDGMECWGRCGFVYVCTRGHLSGDLNDAKIQAIAKSGVRAVGREKRKSIGLKKACLRSSKISVAGS